MEGLYMFHSLNMTQFNQTIFEMERKVKQHEMAEDMSRHAIYYVSKWSRILLDIKP